MNSDSISIRKLLPALILGVVITLAAAALNYTLYDRRLSARVASAAPARSEEDANPVGSGLRIAARLLNAVDDYCQDLMLSLRGPGDFPSTKDAIALIAIDEDSLVRHGGWPWSRSDIARLLAKTTGANVVSLDLLLSDRDRTSLINYVDRFNQYYGKTLDLDRLPPADRLLFDNDLLLARQISRTPVVLGTVLFSGIAPLDRPMSMKNSHPIDIVLPNGESVPPEEVLLKGGRFALTDIGVLRNVTPQPLGEGFMNVFPDANGVVRSIPLFAHVADSAFAAPSGGPLCITPSMPLEVMRVWLGGTGYRINLRGDTVSIPQFSHERTSGRRYAVNTVSILRETEEIANFSLNELGEMEVAFRSHRFDYRVYPAWEVLAGTHDGAFRGKHVIIGGTVAGVGTGVSSGLTDLEMSVPEIHAAALSAMLKGDIIDGGYTYEFFWQQAAILVMGIAVTLAIVLTDAVSGLLLSLLVLAGWSVGNYFFFFRRGTDVGISLPVLATLVVLITLSVTNYLVVGRERRFIRKAFQLNVSPSILGYLENHPDRLSSLQGDYRHMTVLFSDIRGFTSMSEKLSAPDLARFLNEYFTPMSNIVMEHSGTVDKFIGDGMMAFWNAPADNLRHARDAALTSLAMLDKLKELQPDWSSRGLPEISIGCSINTGPMFAGYMGSDQRKNYTVMGDNVNIASRMEGLNKMYSSSILITEATRSELGRDFVCRVVDKVRVSGKEEAVLIHELLGHGAVSEDTAEELASFIRVFELYQEREFAAAQSLLKELVFIRPSPLYSMYLDRLAVYKALPPPPDWDGTFTMMRK